MPQFLSVTDRTAFSKRLASYLKHESITACAVILHGGEPLLIGVETIVEFAALVKDAVGPSVTVDIGLQTNGLLLTSEAIKAFEAANIAVSLSLDGPKEVNDLHRKTRKGRSSYAKTLAALEHLKKHPSTFSGIIAVIDPHVSPESLFSFFDQHQPPKIDFLLPDSHHLRQPPDRELHPDIYEDWLLRAFDLWFDLYPHLRVRTFEALLDAAAGLPSGTDAFGLGDVSLLTVETDGTYHDLDVLKVVAAGATKLSGSVRDTEIAMVAASDALNAHRRLLSKPGLSAECQSCAEVDVCGGGAVPHRFGQNGFDNPTVYCKEMLALIGHIRQRLKKALADSTTVVVDRELPADDFDFGSFEVAEDAGHLIAELWSKSCVDQLSRFHSALDIINKQHDTPSAIVASKTLSQENLREMACRPGSVAWQRTVINSASGQNVFAVDGTALHSDALYIDLLQRIPELTTTHLRIGTNDHWLRAPFGSAILFEPEEIARTARPVVDAALEIIDRWRPKLGEELRYICKDVQFIRDPTADPDKIVSFSDNVVPGALFVSVMRKDRLIDPHDLADSLIHEYRHQKLYLLERLYPMVEATNLRVVSPWRDDLRPPSGLLHAVFVFVELRRFWDFVRLAGPQHLTVRAINQLRDTDAHLEEGLRTLQSCPLTPAGRALANVLDRARTWQRAAA